MSELQTCFRKVDYVLSGLLHYIETGDIGLPDIQRPFVWSNAKVRDLFDSMYRGFPVGYLLFWQNGHSGHFKPIGIDSKQHKLPSRLIVDGQQRLTSLYSVLRGQHVLDDDYQERRIEIAFRPRDGRFEVADAAIRKDPEWVPDISVLWAGGQTSYSIVRNFVQQVQARAQLSADEEYAIARNLDRLFDLQRYPFTALEIAENVDEEQVADIFVRINSEGVRLKQADFVLTLMSVFWEDGRIALEQFCRAARHPVAPQDPPSPFNHFIQPDPDQLLRVAVACGFDRGRIKSVYQLLRGKDLDSGAFSEEQRVSQFARLQEAQAQVLNLTHWHSFLSALLGAGFRSAEMISSQNALLFAYAFYLIGRLRFRLPESRLSRLIGRWFFASSLTARYTGSPESVMDGDLNRVKAVQDAAGFVELLEELMSAELTADFWEQTLPARLDSSSARNPELFCYIAAQNLLGAPVLFSHKKISELLDPALRTKKKALERHHLFPRAGLEQQGLADLKQINQQANFALLEWPENIAIGADAPADYLPRLRERFAPEEWALMQQAHALPADWELLDYADFLAQRRELMAGVIRQGFARLASPAAAQAGA